MQRLYKSLSVLFHQVLDFVYPPACLACNEPLSQYLIICETCWESLERRGHARIHTAESFRYLLPPFYPDQIITCWDYEPRLESLIHQIKYSGRKKAGRLLGRLAAEKMASEILLCRPELIIPVPLHRIRKRERGFNQSRIIAEVFSRLYGLPLADGIIKRVVPTRTQTKLRAQERQLNLRDAFRAVRPGLLREKSILLLDDVVTSGATLNACAKVCREAGAQTVTGLGLVRPHLEELELVPDSP